MQQAKTGVPKLLVCGDSGIGLVTYWDVNLLIHNNRFVMISGEGKEWEHNYIVSLAVCSWRNGCKAPIDFISITQQKLKTKKYLAQVSNKWPQFNWFWILEWNCCTVVLWIMNFVLYCNEGQVYVCCIVILNFILYCYFLF